jgi:YHS domain-containing protein
MLKQILISLVLVSFSSVFALAQEKTKIENKEQKQIENMQKDTNHHEMKMDNSKNPMNQVSTNKPWNKICPVRGEEVDPEVATVKYNSKAYGFCCSGCDSKFSKDPEKYSKNLNEDGTKFIGKK